MNEMQFNEHKKTNIKIYVRPLPRVNEDYKNVKFLDDKKTVYVKCLQDHRMRYGKTDLFWKFEVDEVLYNYSQSKVFETVINNCILEAIEGNNTIFIGYGQTRSGKSFTMNGLYYTYQHRGIAPRMIPSLLSIKRELQDDFKIEYSISFCEMRDNQFFDLLNPTATNWSAQRDNFNKIKNLKKRVFVNEEEALSILFEGEGRRLFDKKLLFKKGKKVYSHLCTGIITFRVKSIPFRKNGAIERCAKIHIIELAGVDTIGNSTCLTKSYTDVGLSNQNKTFLEIFLLYLNTCKEDVEKLKTFKRISLLVNFLSDCLNGRSFIRFICHIKTDEEYLNLTLSMLRMTEIIKKIVPQRPKPYIKNAPEIECKILKKTVRELKKQLMHNAIFMDTDLDNYMCQSRLEHTERTVEAFLENKIDNLKLSCVTHTATVLNILKEKIIKMKQEQGSEGSRFLSSKETLPKQTKMSTESRRTDASSNVGSKRFANEDTSLIRGSIPKTSMISNKQRKDSDNIEGISIVSERENLWKQFMNSEEYKNAHDTVTEFKRKLNTILGNYEKEVKILYELRLNEQKTKSSLMQAQMQRRLSKMDNYDENGSIIASENEIKYWNEVMKLQTDIRRQEDTIFVLQDDLKHIQNQLNDAKQNLENLFEKFCKNSLKYSLMEIKKESIESEKSEIKRSTITGDTLQLVSNQDDFFINSQFYMFKIMKCKNKNDLKTKTKWITDIKR